MTNTLDKDVMDRMALDALEWPLLTYEPWSKQRDFHLSPKATRLLAWANRSGKTSSGAFECVAAGMGVSKLNYPKPPFTIWAVGVDYKQMRDSIIPAFEGDATHPRMLPLGVTLNEQKFEYRLPTGSVIRLKSADSGPLAFQGAAIPLIWLDEDQPKAILNELFVRIGVGFMRRIIWTMTAVKGLTYAYDAFYVPWLEAQEAGGDHPDIYCSEAAMHENPHLNRAEIDKLEQLYPKGSMEYHVRRWGGFKDMAGESMFSEETIAMHKANILAAEVMYLTKGAA